MKGIQEPYNLKLSRESKIISSKEVSPFPLQVKCRFSRMVFQLGSIWFLKIHLRFSSVQSLSCVRLFATPWTAACQAFLSITNSQSLVKLMSIESVTTSNRLILCYPLSSHLQSFPASGSFLMTQLFSSGGQSIRVSASASVLPVIIQDWFPLG